MTFRISTLLATLAVAFLFYATCVWLISLKLEALIGPGPTPPTTARTSDLLLVGVWSASAYLAALTGWWIIQRTLRRSPGHCACCGTRLAITMHRCNFCGVRR